jgi:hypothetical protein
MKQLSDSLHEHFIIDTVAVHGAMLLHKSKPVVGENPQAFCTTALQVVGLCDKRSQIAVGSAVCRCLLLSYCCTCRHVCSPTCLVQHYVIAVFL